MDTIEAKGGMLDRTSRLALTAAVVITFIAAIVVMPQSGYVLTTLAWFALPQLVIIAVVTVIARSGMAALGVAVGLAAWLVWFRVWVMTQPPDGLIWLSYHFSLPGGVLGALVAAFMVRRHRAPLTPWRHFAFGALDTVLGIAANQTMLCMTLVHCVP